MTVVTHRNASRRDRKKADVRSRIIAVAIELFGRHGLAGVTVEHIADVADIGKGTIYNYFETKEDIVVAFMVEKERAIQSRLRRLLRSRQSAKSVLTAYFQLQFQFKRPYHGFVRVFMGQMFARTAQMLPCMAEMQPPIDANLNALLDGLQSRGAIRRDLDRAALILVLKTIHMGLNVLWAVEGPPFRVTHRVMKQEVRLFCEGLEAK